LGEGLASRWLELTSDPAQRYKLELFLLLAGHDLSLVEDQRQRSAGAAVAEKFASMPWREAMATLADPAHPYLERFRALLAAAALEDEPMIAFMVDHEAAVIRIAQREAAGDASMDRELLTMLSYPLVRRG
jgi:hypothetical protein